MPPERRSEYDSVRACSRLRLLDRPPESLAGRLPRRVPPHPPHLLLLWRQQRHRGRAALLRERDTEADTRRGGGNRLLARAAVEHEDGGRRRLRRLSHRGQPARRLPDPRRSMLPGGVRLARQRRADQGDLPGGFHPRDRGPHDSGRRRRRAQRGGGH